MSYKWKPLPAGTPEKTDRVRYVAQLMATGEYYGHKTCFELADKWKLGLDTVRQDVAEAGRYLKLDPEERAQRRHELAAWAHATAERILETPSRVTGLPDYKAAIEAQRLAGVWQGVSDRVVETDNPDNAPKEALKIQIIHAKDDDDKD